MTLFLVRHGPPVIDFALAASSWELDPGGFDAVWALRESGRLPRGAAWFCSGEPKAVQTAQLLTDGEVGVVPALGEHRRTAGRVDDMPATVARAFADPDRPAHPGWEPLAACRERVVDAVRDLRAAHVGSDLVLVGHGTAWTLVVAALTGCEPDLDRWRALGMPDVIEVADADILDG